MWDSGIHRIRLTGLEMLPKLLDILLTGQAESSQIGLCQGVFLLDMGINLVVIVVGGANFRRRVSRISIYLLFFVDEKD